MTQYKYYNIKLETVEPFRIGGKPDLLSEADNPVAVVGGRVCIPGSTFKGAYRAELERWFNEKYFTNSQWKDIGLQPCIPSAKYSPDEQTLIDNKRFRSQTCKYPSKNQSSICPICYLLGAQGLVGFVNVPFLFTDVTYESLYSARLERTSHTVMHGTNRPYQLIPPDTVFEGKMEVLLEDELLGWKLGQQRPLKENPNADNWLVKRNWETWDQDRILKELIVSCLQSISRMGGYRSKGFGKVKITVTDEHSSAK
jgi:CRISPR/Cas system CSM-associated protein Csm3 (group 7 of RAMP superfamily)